MIGKAVLDQAKAFLAWDVFPELSIQLVETSQAVSYYTPPSGRSSLVVFYERGKDDFSFPLFLLFHEAGHHLQWRRAEQNRRTQQFWDAVNLTTGPEKTAFEREGWDLGRDLFHKFLQEFGLDDKLLDTYDRTADRSIDTYR